MKQKTEVNVLVFFVTRTCEREGRERVVARTTVRTLERTILRLCVKIPLTFVEGHLFLTQTPLTCPHYIRLEPTKSPVTNVGRFRP